MERMVGRCVMAEYVWIETLHSSITIFVLRQNAVHRLATGWLEQKEVTEREEEHPEEVLEADIEFDTAPSLSFDVLDAEVERRAGGSFTSRSSRAEALHSDRPLSEETRQKISERMKGNTLGSANKGRDMPWLQTEAVRQAKSQKMKGRKYSEEMKKSIWTKEKRAAQAERARSQAGRTLSEETKKKLSEKKKAYYARLSEEERKMPKKTN